ncbi:15401_t:CDS:1, partial [Gigaspora rosea]
LDESEEVEELEGFEEIKQVENPNELNKNKMIKNYAKKRLQQN